MKATEERAELGKGVVIDRRRGGSGAKVEGQDGELIEGESLVIEQDGNTAKGGRHHSCILVDTGPEPIEIHRQRSLVVKGGRSGGGDAVGEASEERGGTRCTLRGKGHDQNYRASGADGTAGSDRRGLERDTQEAGTNGSGRAGPRWNVQFEVVGGKDGRDNSLVQRLGPARSEIR